MDIHDSDVWTLLHFQSGIHEAVLGDSGVGVDEEDYLTTNKSAKRS